MDITDHNTATIVEGIVTNWISYQLPTIGIIIAVTWWLRGSFANVFHRIDNLEKNQTVFGEKLSRLEHRFDNLENRFDSLEHKFDILIFHLSSSRKKVKLKHLRSKKHD